MKKLIILCLLLILVGSVVGCKNKSAAEDAYNNLETVNDIDETEALNSETQTTIEESTEAVVESSVEADNIDETPVADVYEAASESITFDYSEFEGVELQQVTDETIKEELQKYLYDFYFNYFFIDGLDEETGNVGADAMTLFAISYIMQYEYNELKFDDKTFSLVIPKDHVIHIVQKFFYKQLDVFKSYEDLAITYDDDAYTVVVKNYKWDVDLKLNRVEQLGDFTYRVLCDIVSTSGIVKEQVEAVVDESHNGHVLVNYIVIKVEE